MKTLILTEKPSIARDFALALGLKGKKEGFIEGDDYVITWAVGHLVELADPADYDAKWKKWSFKTLPILPEHLKYKPIPGTQKQLKIVQKQLTRKDARQIVIATDAGREGEVIARTILSSVPALNGDIYRFWTSQALTPPIVKEALQSLRPAADYDRLWQAGQARQAADWLVGMNLSRAATLKLGGLGNVYSVGRVQTAVLALLVDRRRERDEFKPEPYWVLKANFSALDRAEATWWGTWFKKDQNRFDTKQAGEQVLALITGQTGKVKSVKREQKKQAPPLLYSLTDLQRDANSKFGFSARQTLDIAQKLYEEKKCLSYPRTDSKVLGSKNVDLVKKLIQKLTSAYSDIFRGVQAKLIAASNKRVFNDAKLTDHHALIPLAPLPERAGRSESLIYRLVLKRFAAAFHPDYEYEATEVITEVQKETFRSRGNRPVVPGWKVVYARDAQSDEEKTESGEQDLPLLEKDEPARVEEAALDEKMTLPPPEYSEALLLKDMTNPSRYVSEQELKKIFKGDVGLGTQATRAQIIETLLARLYIVREQKKLRPTAKGCSLIDNLRRFEIAKAIAMPEETARWEMELEKIAQGIGDSNGFMAAIRKFVAEGVEELKMNDMHKTVPQPLGMCPACGGKIIEGKKGFGCSNWREQDGGCRFVVWKEIAGQKITAETLRLLLSGEITAPLKFTAKDGKPFTASLKLEENKQEGRWLTRFVMAAQDAAPAAPDSNNAPGEPSALGVCPRCGGEVVEGKKGFGCSKWREQDGGCKFVIWKEIAGKKLSEADVKKLLEEGQTGIINGFISKKGREFSARLKLNEELKTVFVF
ncbi:MAG: DNA topoisomerase 3 [Desulforhabdus sp.]|nr:DNA topoisomerase 3 [Desulforhabdus sp.]